MTGALTGQQVERYEREGFLFPIDAMSAEEARAFRNRLERTEKDYAACGHDRPIAHYLMGGRVAHRLPSCIGLVPSSPASWMRPRASSVPT